MYVHVMGETVAVRGTRVRGTGNGNGIDSIVPTPTILSMVTGMSVISGDI